MEHRAGVGKFIIRLVLNWGSIREMVAAVKPVKEATLLSPPSGARQIGARGGPRARARGEQLSPASRAERQCAD